MVAETDPEIVVVPAPRPNWIFPAPVIEVVGLVRLCIPVPKTSDPVLTASNVPLLMPPPFNVNTPPAATTTRAEELLLKAAPNVLEPVTFTAPAPLLVKLPKPLMVNPFIAHIPVLLMAAPLLPR